MLIEFAGDAKKKAVRFDDGYLARLRNNDDDTAKHFQKYFRSKVRNMLFGKFYRQREEDLVDEVMAAVIERIMAGEPRDAGLLTAYVRAVCANFIKKEIKVIHPRDERGDLDLDKISGQGRTPEEIARAKEKAKAVWDALGALRLRDRNVLIDLFYYELDRDEVCKKYGKTRDQVKMILYHARRRFQDNWGDRDKQ
jgi:RNA polymerase sigma factor (sigma-70 family)